MVKVTQLLEQIGGEVKAVHKLLKIVPAAALNQGRAWATGKNSVDWLSQWLMLTAQQSLH